MVKLNDIANEPRKLIKSTKFARIFNINDKYAIKSICTDYIVAPHNHEVEKSILLKLRDAIEESSSKEVGSFNIIGLLDFGKNVTDEDEVELLFNYYPMSLYELMRSQYKFSGHETDEPPRKFNPYYDLTSGTDKSATVEKKRLKYVNCFDVDKYAFRYMLQISEGIQFIHSQNIIHRDIKPQNIMVDLETDLLKITDFGISYDNDNLRQTIDEPQERKITDVSTSIYKAPELLLGVKNYSYAVDIWSLLILVSQWFQKDTNMISTSGKPVCESRDDFYIPGMIDDGTQEGENGSDIRLLLSIFSKFGYPKINDWKEVSEFGSEDAFVGMFGGNGDDKYVKYQSVESQCQLMESLLPRIGELANPVVKEGIIRIMTQMVEYDSTRRITSVQLVKELRSLQ